jgi:hypothetical protein
MRDGFRPAKAAIATVSSTKPRRRRPATTTTATLVALALVARSGSWSHRAEAAADGGRGGIGGGGRFRAVGVVAGGVAPSSWNAIDDDGARVGGVASPSSRRRRAVVDRGGASDAVAVVARGGASEAAAAAAVDDDSRRSRTVHALHRTSFLMAAALSMVMFAPLPALTRHLLLAGSSSLSSSTSSLSPQARAVKILSMLSAVSASIELLLSPLIGSLIDAKGRKGPAAILACLVSSANLFASVRPGAFSVCLSRTANVLGGGFAVIITNAVVADLFGGVTATGAGGGGGGGGGGEKMGSVLGAQAAYASLGFLLGSAAGGRLAERSERLAYAASSALSALAACNVAFRMPESLDFASGGSPPRPLPAGRETTDDEDDVPAAGSGTRFLEAPLSSVRLMYSYGLRMRTLAALLLLQSIPMYM